MIEAQSTSRDRKSPSKCPNPAHVLLPSFPFLRTILDIHLLTDWLTMHTNHSYAYAYHLLYMGWLGIPNLNDAQQRS